MSKQQPSDPDMDVLMEALDDINSLMKGRDREYSFALAVALRDWMCDRWADDDFGYDIMLEVGGAVKYK
jgi:hypothetical protein